jgi:hypothetical protein
MLGVLVLLGGWAFLARLDAVLLMLVAALWAFMLCWEAPSCWWLLVIIHLYGAIISLDPVLTAHRFTLLPCALTLIAGLGLLLSDPPTRWHKRTLPEEVVTGMTAEERQRRDAFLTWWTTQSAVQRQSVWLRLSPDERAWALAEMPPDIRTIYRQIERAAER